MGTTASVTTLSWTRRKISAILLASTSTVLLSFVNFIAASSVNVPGGPKNALVLFGSLSEIYSACLIPVRSCFVIFLSQKNLRLLSRIIRDAEVEFWLDF